MNGGFGHVLDGSADAAVKARRMLQWDVANGVARRCWSGSVHTILNSESQKSNTD